MSVARSASIALSLALSVVAGCTGADGDAGNSGATRVEVGSEMPAYRAATLDGDSVSLAAMRDTVVLLNVWATWCHPCRDEIPELIALRNAYHDRGFEIVGVTVDAGGSEDQVRQFMRDFEMNYPVWHDPDDRISTRYLLVGVPTTFLIDRQGILRWRKTGPIAPGDTALASAIERALAG